MAKVLEMTQLSPTMEEGVFVKWLVSKGDEVGVGDMLAEVETDKAVMELECFDKGVVLELIVNEGAKVKVGQPVAIVGKKGEDISSLLKEIKSASDNTNTTQNKSPEKVVQEVKESSSAKKSLKDLKIDEGIKVLEMTQLSPTMSEGVIVQWLVSKGDEVGVGDMLAEVETDKAVMELECFDKGSILEILLQKGSSVKVGQPVAIIGPKGRDVSELAKQVLELDFSSSNEEDISNSKEAAVSSSAASSKVDSKITELNLNDKKSSIEHDGFIKASPLAKKIALKHTINLSNIKGTGPNGRIIKRDLEEYLSKTSTSSAQTQTSFISHKEEKLPITEMRNVIAKRLQSSKNNVPHFYLTLEFDAEPVVLLRKEINQDLANSKSPLKISLNDFIIKATANALVAKPQVNVSWRNDHILQHGRVDVGVAVAIENGLITPYIRNTNYLSLSQISVQMKELAKKARERKLKPEEYTDGCFTISNLGMYGLNQFSAIINEPESCILAVGGLIEKPVVKNGAVVCGKTITVTLSCDHRAIDGASGAEFLAIFKENLEKPYKMLI